VTSPDPPSCPAGCGRDMDQQAILCLECIRRLPGMLRYELLRRGQTIDQQHASAAAALGWLREHPAGPRADLMALDSAYKRRNLAPAYAGTNPDGSVRFYGGHVAPDLPAAVDHLAHLVSTGQPTTRR